MRPSNQPRWIALLLTPLALGITMMLSGGLANQDDAPAPPATEAPSTWAVDAVHSTALFRVKHMAAGAFWGRFNEPSGDIIWSEAGKACPEINVTIPINSIDSANEKLDSHLRSPDFFNEPEFPSMSFKSTGCTPDGENHWDMKGELTLLGQTKPINVKLEHVGTADIGRGMRTGFEAIFQIKRSEYGMNWGVSRGALGDEVRVIVSLEAIKQ